MHDSPIDRPAIARVHDLIAPHIRTTPIVTLDGAEIGRASGTVTLKLEQLQHAGSFKTRGAFAHLLTRPIPAAGVVAASGGIAADSLAPRRVGDLMFPIAREFVERVVLVPDAAIRAAQDMLWDRLRIVAEPGGAAAFAALCTGAYHPAPGERVGVILSGGNTAVVNFDAA